MDRTKRTSVRLLRSIYLVSIIIFGMIALTSSGGGGGGNDNGGDNSSASLSSIAVTPNAGSVPLGRTQSFTATGSYSDGATQDLTSSAVWSSSDTSIASIDASGLATSEGRGTATISATVSGISGSATLTVTQAELASINVTPVDPTLSYNEAVEQFTATGIYTDNSALDITDIATWSSSDVAVATIGSDGFAAAVAITGSTAIGATLGAVSGSTTLTVHTAAVSGEIAFPESDMGWQPSLYHSVAKVRVEGTDIYAEVVRTTGTTTTGSFTITGVPYGSLTLVFEEGMNTSADVQNDAFTQASKRVEVDVNTDSISGVAFNLVYHWKELEGYPDVWGSSELYGYPRAFFVNDLVAFILFRINANDRIELYRTLDRGAAWDLIGSWTYDDDDYSNGGAWPAWWLDMYFIDQDHGMVLATTHCTPCSDCGSHYFYTADGGGNWTLTSLPLPDGKDINPSSYARIGADHLIMGGTVGCGVQGYSGPFYDAVWESEDGGETWECRWHSEEDEMGDIIGLDANEDGKAIGFRGDDIQEFILRDEEGNWTSHANTEGIYDSARDIAMVDDTAWIRSKDGTASNGLYRTTDAGETWNLISDMILVDFDFATIKKGFNHTSGDTYVTYDGGLTWRYQGMGGYIWPGNMDIWAFDTTHAAWAEGGSYSDPNDEKDLFTYVEPWEPSFEILAGAAISDSTISAGSSNVSMASYQFSNLGPVPININSIVLQASGSGNDADDITSIELWWDKNSDGAVDSGDTLLSTAGYSANNGTASLTINQACTIEQFIPMQMLVTYDLGSSLNSPCTFRVSLDPEDIDAERTDTNAAVLPGAPEGFLLTGPTITVSQ